MLMEVYRKVRKGVARKSVVRGIGSGRVRIGKGSGSDSSCG